MAGSEPLGGQVNEQQPGGSTTLCEACNYTTAAGREAGGREESNLFTSSQKLGWEFIDFFHPLCLLTACQFHSLLICKISSINVNSIYIVMQAELHKEKKQNAKCI